LLDVQQSQRVLYLLLPTGLDSRPGIRTAKTGNKNSAAITCSNFAILAELPLGSGNSAKIDAFPIFNLVEKAKKRGRKFLRQRAYGDFALKRRQLA